MTCELGFPLSMGILLMCLFLSSTSECFRRFGILETPFFQQLRLKLAEMRKANPISFISVKSEELQEFEWMGAGPGGKKKWKATGPRPAESRRRGWGPQNNAQSPLSKHREPSESQSKSPVPGALPGVNLIGPAQSLIPQG